MRQSYPSFYGAWGNNENRPLLYDTVRQLKESSLPHTAQKSSTPRTLNIKMLLTAFWNAHGNLIFHFMDHGATVKTDHYFMTLCRI
jgi:hypothetical protein